MKQEKKINKTDFRDKVLSATDRVRCFMFRIWVLLQMLPWNAIMNFLNQSGAKDEIEKKVKDRFNKPNQ